LPPLAPETTAETEPSVAPPPVAPQPVAPPPFVPPRVEPVRPAPVGAPVGPPVGLPQGANPFGPPVAPPLFEPAPSAAAAAAAARAEQRRSAASAPLDAVVRLRLGAALDRLDPATQRSALAVLAPFARSLEPDEDVEHLAQGWSKGLMCLVARTDRRVVVVVDRFPEPRVESLHRARTRISVYGPPEVDRVSLAVVDGRRLLEIAGVRDHAEARALAEPVPQAAAVPEFF
jgi:hypothetical protein